MVWGRHIAITMPHDATKRGINGKHQQQQQQPISRTNAAQAAAAAADAVARRIRIGRLKIEVKAAAPSHRSSHRMLLHAIRKFAGVITVLRTLIMYV